MSNYVFKIFSTRGVRFGRLLDTIYRFWSSYAITYEFRRRLAGQIDFLDVGGRDGGTLRLLHALGLGGSYTCMDLKPDLQQGRRLGFDVEAVSADYKTFQTDKSFDAVLFESSLEFSDNYGADLSWLAGALKDNGFALVTVITPGTSGLYPGFYAAGGFNGISHDQIKPAFEVVGLKVDSCYPLMGRAGRLGQYYLQLKLGRIIKGLWNKSIGALFPICRQYNPVLLYNLLINVASVPLDFLFRGNPVGHCIVLQKIKP